MSHVGWPMPVGKISKLCREGVRRCELGDLEGRRVGKKEPNEQ